MEAYTFSDYVHFNNMTDNTKRRHIGFILNQRHDRYIISLLKVTEETFKSFPDLFVKKMLEPWMNSSIQIVPKLSKVNLWNQHIQ